MRQETDRQADGEACHEPRGQLAELMIGAFTGLDVGLGGEVAEQLGGLPTAGSEATAGRDRPARRGHWHACLASVHERMLRLRQLDQVLEKIQRACAGQGSAAICPATLAPLTRWGPIVMAAQHTTT